MRADRHIHAALIDDVDRKAESAAYWVAAKARLDRRQRAGGPRSYTAIAWIVILSASAVAAFVKAAFF